MTAPTTRTANLGAHRMRSSTAMKNGSAAMKKRDGMKSIGLALQGGGAHTAFCWGVLDRLLDEVAGGNLHIDAISGTSGGAFNAAVCAYGLIDGPDRAKRLLREFWQLVSAQSLWPPDPFRMLL